MHPNIVVYLWLGQWEKAPARWPTASWVSLRGFLSKFWPAYEDWQAQGPQVFIFWPYAEIIKDTWFHSQLTPSAVTGGTTVVLCYTGKALLSLSREKWHSCKYILLFWEGVLIINIVAQRSQPPSLSKARSRKHTAPRNRFLQKPRQRLGAGNTAASAEQRQQGFTNCRAGTLWPRPAALRPVSLTAKTQDVPPFVRPVPTNFQLDFEPFISLHFHC